ncbi:MAG: cobyric acid synthase [Actinomycetota bacterium]|nr:cobyric acid synthase [Actinomycetota bacterium]
MKGSLLVAGTTSDAGKSVVAVALCRWLARQGVRVAPYKAQNMANNSMVTADGAEIGRAQWVQALAAGAEPEAAMNPVLLKPGSDRRSHVVVMGRPYGELDAASFAVGRRTLAEAAHAAYDDLAARYDVVVCEGAGSPTEINLREHDYVNMGLARHAGMPTVVVGDIDRGGVLAALFGTTALLCAEDQALVSGYVLNKFRGDAGLLEPGLRMLESVTGRSVYGVLPWLPGVWLDSEDALAVDARAAVSEEEPVLRVAVLRLPRISNFTDLDALGVEPNVDVRFVDSADAVLDADLVVVPGTRATLADLEWLRVRGVDAALRRRAAEGRPVLGVCGGFQMLGEWVDDPAAVEAPRPRRVEGLGLLAASTRFQPDKTLGRPSGTWRGAPVTGYVIHHGRVEVHGGDPFPGGCRRGPVWGTLWHGALENDEFRRAWLTEVADQAGRTDWSPPADTSFTGLRVARLDLLADAVEEHLDTAALLTLVEKGPPPHLPFVGPGAPGVEATRL